MTLQFALKCNCGGARDYNVAGRLDSVFNVTTGEDISRDVPIHQALLLHDAARSGEEIDVELFLRRDGKLYINASGEVARTTVRARIHCE